MERQSAKALAAKSLLLGCLVDQGFVDVRNDTSACNGGLRTESFFKMRIFFNAERKEGRDEMSSTCWPQQWTLTRSSFTRVFLILET